MTTDTRPAGRLQPTGTGETLTSGDTENDSTMSAPARAWRMMTDDGDRGVPGPPDVGCHDCGAPLTWASMCESCERAALAASFAGNGGAR